MYGSISVDERLGIIPNSFVFAIFIMSVCVYRRISIHVEKFFLTCMEIFLYVYGNVQMCRNRASVGIAF